VRTTIAAGLGTLIEWYDYGLYGIVAGLVIAPLFFPEATGAVGLLATFATFAVGFLARPVGGIVLGALSDRWGRRPVLILSIVLIGVSTTLIGLLPGFAQIGVWAPALLVLLRLTQGFGAGAELAGAITLLNESATRRRKGFYASFAMASGLAGSIVATLLFTIITASISSEAFLAWGWRIPFLLSAVLTVIGVLLRRRMGESPEFERVQREREQGTVRQARANPLVALGQSIKASPRNWIAGFLLPSGLNVTGFVMLAFGISYLANTVGLPREQTLLVNLTMLVTGALICVLWGHISDRIGARKVMIIGIVGAILMAYPYFLLLQGGNLAIILPASALMFAFAWSAGSASHTVLMPALFKAEYRSSGLFSSRELQGALIAGPAPLIATALLAALGGQPWLVVGLVVVSQLLTLVGLLLGRPFVSAAEIAETPALQGVTPR
jgi:MFS family permease